MSDIVPFHDDNSRRQWESSIGINHSKSKVSQHSAEANHRLFSNPLKEKAVAASRPISPLLNLDEDFLSCNLDEYADVAGCFFSNVMTTKVPSRSGKRHGGGKKQSSANADHKTLAVRLNKSVMIIEKYLSIHPSISIILYC